jgi:hypothetical protein
MPELQTTGSRLRKTIHLLREQRRVSGLSDGAPDLEETLSEMGPNHATEFADALAIEGVETSDRTFHMTWESLGKFRESFTDFLTGIRHAFVGGVAVRSYKARLEPTLDYDVMVDAAEMPRVMAFMEKNGVQWTGMAEDGATHFFVLRLHGRLFHVDVREAKTALDREALDGARPASYGERKLRILEAGHLAALKIEAYAARKDTPKGRLDAQDVAGLLSVGAATEAAVRDILRRHRPELMKELDEILTDARGPETA